jgi:hypothetical protein
MNLNAEISLMVLFLRHQHKKTRRINTPNDMALPPSAGEIHYLWWYMQGSIMNQGVRLRLLKAWGFCERHAWIALLVESSFRRRFLLGPAIVYEDIISRAVKVMPTRGPMKNLQIMAGLRERGGWAKPSSSPTLVA